MRIIALVCLLLFAGTSELTSQEGPSTRPYEIGAQTAWLPLYWGDATVGGVHAVALGLRAAYALPAADRRLALEAAYTHAWQDRDPYNRHPRFDLLSLRLRMSALPPGDPRPRLFGSAGIGVERIEAEEIFCDPAAGCFLEGGPRFRDATLPTLVLGAGLTLPMTEKLAIQSEIGLHRPVGEEPDAPTHNRAGRIEVSIGAVLRF